MLNNMSSWVSLGSLLSLVLGLTNLILFESNKIDLIHQGLSEASTTTKSLESDLLNYLDINVYRLILFRVKERPMVNKFTSVKRVVIKDFYSKILP